MESLLSWKPLRISLFILLILFLSSCQTQQVTIPAPTSEPTVALQENNLDYPAVGIQESESSSDYPGPASGSAVQGEIPSAAEPEQPEPGMASISGVLFSKSTNGVLPNTMFYLTHGLGEEQKVLPPAFLGPIPESGDIEIITDERGLFSANNIPPGNYYLVVEAAYDWTLVLASEEETSPMLLELKPDQKYGLEVIYVSWP